MDLSKLGITEDQLDIILETLMEWGIQTIGEYDGFWYGYNTLSDDTGVEVKILKKVLKILRDKKIVTHSPCINEEGLTNGSGNYMLDIYCEKTLKEVKELINE